VGELSENGVLEKAEDGALLLGAGGDDRPDALGQRQEGVAALAELSFGLRSGQFATAMPRAKQAFRRRRMKKFS
jgi:hypothetical protein